MELAQSDIRVVLDVARYQGDTQVERVCAIAAAGLALREAAIARIDGEGDGVGLVCFGLDAVRAFDADVADAVAGAGGGDA